MKAIAVTVLSLFVVSTDLAEAQLRDRIKQRRAARKPVTQPNAQPVAQAPAAAWARKLFDVEKIDFGVIARGSNSKKYIKIKNVLDQPVNIQTADTTCGCSVATPSKKLLNPGDEAVIEVTMDTRKFKRRKDSNLLVTFNQPSFTTVRIPITAYIRTDVVFDPGMVQFGHVETGLGAERKIKIAYAGRPDWVIRSLKVGSEYLTARFNETQRSGGRVDYDLDVQLKKNAPVGSLRALITLVTDDKANPFVPLLVEAHVGSDITVAPKIVSLGKLAPGVEKRSQVIIRSNSKKPFEVQKMVSKNGIQGLKYQRPIQASPLHRIPFSLKAPDKPGRFEEELQVWIEGQPKPVTFKVTGEIETRIGSRD